MSVAEAEKLLLSLPESERAKFAEKLIASLPSPSVDEDDGIALALRRSREMNEDPSLTISPEDLDAMVRERFPQCVSE